MLSTAHTKKIQYYIRHVARCFEDAREGISSLNEDVLALEGMSGTETRHLYNNLCRLRIPGQAGAAVRYLEIGTWKGSSLISSLTGNDHVEAICIDNFSEFGGPRAEFDANRAKFIPNSKLTVLDDDCFAPCLLSEDQKFDIYLYDGGHSREQQRDAITKFVKHLADVSVVVVDDWNNQAVHQGTMDGLKECADVLRVCSSTEVRYTSDGSHTPMDIARSGFWNGLCVMVVERL